MTWTAPATWSVSEIVVASKMNTHIRDNLDYLKGNAGTVAIAAGMTMAGTVAVTGPITATSTIASGDDITAVLAAGATLTAQGTNNGSFGRFRMLAKTAGAATVDWRFLANGNGVGEFSLYDGVAAATRLLIDANGNVGLDTTAPNTRLDVLQGNGHMGFWSNNAITAKQVILAAGVVTRACVGSFVAGSNDGALTSTGPSWSTLTLGGAAALISSGADVLTVTLSAGGELSIARAGGTKTYTAAFMIIWY